MVEKNKLRQLLIACRKEELQPLKRFVRSPYFNRQPELIPLLDYLIKLWPDMPTEKMTKTTLYETAYPGQPFDPKQYRYLTSWLCQMIEQFWGVERWQQSGRQAKILTMSVATERGIENTYRKINRKLEPELNTGSELSDVQKFYEIMSWSTSQEIHFGRTRERKYNEGIQHINDNLDRYYYLEKLRTVCVITDRKALFAGDYQLNITENLEQHIIACRFFNTPVIQLYFQLWQILKEESNELPYQVIKQNLKQETIQVDTPDLHTIYQLLINYCARKIREGKDNYISEALDWYESGLTRNILLTNGELSPWAFTNIVKLAMRLKRYDWGERFIQQYSTLLPEGFKTNAMHYNLAELYYYTHRHDEALIHLNQVAYSDLNYYLGARVLLTKIYYEQKAEEPLLPLLAAFMIFLKRNKEISTPIKQTYLNYCNFLLLLLKKKPKQMADLDQRISATQLLTDRQWLLEQWGQIGRKR